MNLGIYTLIYIYTYTYIYIYICRCKYSYMYVYINIYLYINMEWEREWRHTTLHMFLCLLYCMCVYMYIRMPRGFYQFCIMIGTYSETCFLLPGDPTSCSLTDWRPLLTDFELKNFDGYMKRCGLVCFCMCKDRSNGMEL